MDICFLEGYLNHYLIGRNKIAQAKNDDSIAREDDSPLFGDVFCLCCYTGCIVCEDSAPFLFGEVAELVDAPLNNRNANLRCGELGNSSRFDSGFLHESLIFN